jgi:hypothetical protein
MATLAVPLAGIPAVPLAGLPGGAWHLATVFCLQMPQCLFPVSAGTPFRHVQENRAGPPAQPHRRPIAAVTAMPKSHGADADSDIVRSAVTSPHAR